MARDGEAVDPLIAAAVAAFVLGDRFEVAAKRRGLKISQQTFYKYVARFGAEGVEGSRDALAMPSRCHRVRVVMRRAGFRC
jgi:hypothetical protein